MQKEMTSTATNMTDNKCMHAIMVAVGNMHAGYPPDHDAGHRAKGTALQDEPDCSQFASCEPFC